MSVLAFGKVSNLNLLHPLQCTRHSDLSLPARHCTHGTDDEESLSALLPVNISAAKDDQLP